MIIVSYINLRGDISINCHQLKSFDYRAINSFQSLETVIFYYSVSAVCSCQNDNFFLEILQLIGEARAAL